MSIIENYRDLIKHKTEKDQYRKSEKTFMTVAKMLRKFEANTYENEVTGDCVLISKEDAKDLLESIISANIDRNWRYMTKNDIHGERLLKTTQILVKAIENY